MPAPRPAALSIAAASILLLGGCTGTLPTSGASVTLAESTQSSQGPAYPIEPTIDWRFTAESLGLPTAEKVLSSPTTLSSFEGIPFASIIDAGNVWVTVASAHPHWNDSALLVGISPETGRALWTYQPEESMGSLFDCAADVTVEGNLACVVGDPSTERSSVALIATESGTEVETFPLPWWSTEIAVTGEDVVVLSTQSQPNVVARFTRTGAEVWSTPFTPAGDGVDGTGGWVRFDVVGSVAAVDYVGVIRAFDVTDGGILIDSGTGTYARTPDGSLVFGPTQPGSGQTTITIVSPDARVQSLEERGMAMLPAAVEGAEPPALLLRPNGEILALDTTDGSTVATGVTVDPQGAGSGVYGGSVVRGTLVLSLGGRLRGYQLSAPTVVAWETGHNYDSAYADGDLLYNLASDLEGNSSMLEALEPSNGETAWSVDTDAQGLDLVNRALITLSDEAITRLAP